MHRLVLLHLPHPVRLHRVPLLLLLALVISFFNIWRKLRKKARDDY